MPGIADGDAVQINAVGLFFGQVTVTTFFYKLSFGAPIPDGIPPALFAQAWFDGYGSSYEDVLSTEWSWMAVEVKDPRTTQLWASDAVDVEGAGTLAGSPLPPSVAVVVSRKSTFPGRRGRGRIYIPAVPESYHENGKLSDAGFAIYKAWSDVFHEATTDTILGVDVTKTPAVWSRLNQTAYPVQAAITRKILRSQRRREIGVGI